MNPSWPDIEAFYAEDERREHSIEKDLPGIFFMESWDDRYRLAWVVQTGELIAVAANDGRVELLGWVDSHARALKMLAGSVSHANRLKGFYEIRKRIHQGVRAHPGKVIEGVDVTDEDRDRAAGDAGSLF